MTLVMSWGFFSSFFFFNWKILNGNIKSENGNLESLLSHVS